MNTFTFAYPGQIWPQHTYHYLPNDSTPVDNILTNVLGSVILVLFADLFGRFKERRRHILAQSSPDEIYVVLPPKPFSTDQAPINVAGWIAAMEDYFKIVRVPEEGKLPMAQILLFKHNLVVEDLIEGARPPATWTEFKFALRTRYSPLGQRKAASAKLAAHELKQTDSVYEYVSALEVLMAVADDVTNSGRRRNFLRGLKPAILEELQAQGSHETLSYHHLVEKAKKIHIRLCGAEAEGPQRDAQTDGGGSSLTAQSAQQRQHGSSAQAHRSQAFNFQHSSLRSYKIPVSKELRSHPISLAKSAVWLPVVNGLVRCAYYVGPKHRGWFRWLVSLKPRRTLCVKEIHVDGASDWYCVQFPHNGINVRWTWA